MIVKHSPFNLSRIATGLAVAGSIATAAPVVVAQDSAMLEEIIVTARKMYEPLQTVPVAVSAFSGETIDSLVMRDIREIEGFIPIFQIMVPLMNGCQNMRQQIWAKGWRYTKLVSAKPATRENT